MIKLHEATWNETDQTFHLGFWVGKDVYDTHLITFAIPVDKMFSLLDIACLPRFAGRLPIAQTIQEASNG